MRGHHRPRSCAERGFSLVELMISAVVALIALASLVHMVLGTAQTGRVDEETNLALAACTAKMEELREMPFELLPKQDGHGFDVVGRMGETVGLSPRNGDPDGFPMLVEVDLVEGKGREVLYRVEVSVEWLGVSGERSLSLVSIMTDRRGS